MASMTRSNCRYCNRSFKWQSSRQIHEQTTCPKRPRPTVDTAANDDAAALEAASLRRAAADMGIDLDVDGADRGEQLIQEEADRLGIDLPNATVTMDAAALVSCPGCGSTITVPQRPDWDDQASWLAPEQWCVGCGGTAVTWQPPSQIDSAAMLAAIRGTWDLDEANTEEDIASQADVATEDNDQQPVATWIVRLHIAGVGSAATMAIGCAIYTLATGNTAAW